MNDAQKKETKKVTVEVMRRCKDNDGNEYKAGDTPELDKKLAQRFLDDGVIKAKL